jgi:hypothetical protein
MPGLPYFYRNLEVWFVRAGDELSGLSTAKSALLWMTFTLAASRSSLVL